MRFASHRDFQRAFERALRRAGAPVASSAGFTPHPRISYAGAAPTGTASEAEYLEVGLTRPVPPAEFREAVGSALPDGLDLVDVVDVPPGCPKGWLAEQLEASEWRIVLPGVAAAEAAEAVARFRSAATVPVERMTRDGRRPVDARAGLVRLDVDDGRDTPAGTGGQATPAACAILHLVVRHATPVVRPDDVLAGLRQLSGLVPTAPAQVTRLAQGPLDEVSGTVADPFHAVRTDRPSDVTGA
jgi:radical SAM-linked protein